MSKKNEVVKCSVLKKGSKKELGKQIQSYLLDLSDDQNKVLDSLVPKNRDEEIIFHLLNELYPVSMSAKDIHMIFDHLIMGILYQTICGKKHLVE